MAKVPVTKGRLAHLPTMATLCANCGKMRGEHHSRTLACPEGPRTRIGTILFSTLCTFSPK